MTADTKKAAPNAPSVLTVAETAARLRMGERTLYDWIASGNCPLTVLRIGSRMRFSAREVQRFTDGELR